MTANSEKSLMTDFLNIRYRQSKSRPNTEMYGKKLGPVTVSVRSRADCVYFLAGSRYERLARRHAYCKGTYY